MSSVLVHICLGVLTALAARIDWRLVPLFAVLAEAPDLDHLVGSGGRSFLHNVWILVVVPSVLAGVAIGTPGAPTWFRRAAAAVPVVLLSHILLDMFPQATERSSPLVPLLWPLDDRAYRLSPYYADASQATAVSSLGVVAALLALACTGVGAACWAAKWLEERGRDPRWAGFAFAFGLPATVAACIAFDVVGPVGSLGPG